MTRVAESSTVLMPCRKIAQCEPSILSRFRRRYFDRVGGIQMPVSREMWETLDPIAQDLTKHMLTWGEAPVRDSLAAGDEREGMGEGFERKEAGAARL